MIDLAQIKWNSDGLIPVIVQEMDGRVLMLAYANREALEKTIETSWMHYWSRSRQKLWKKGETSGHTQRVVSLYLDCDQDVVLARVEQTGPACHTNAPTCFGDLAPDLIQELWRIFADRVQAPKADSYVKLLLNDERRLRQKIGEEAVEVALTQSNEELVRESADLVFHLCVLLFARGLKWSDLLAELARRRR